MWKPWARSLKRAKLRKMLSIVCCCDMSSICSNEHHIKTADMSDFAALSMKYWTILTSHVNNNDYEGESSNQNSNKIFHVVTCIFSTIIWVCEKLHRYIPKFGFKICISFITTPHGEGGIFWHFLAELLNRGGFNYTQDLSFAIT